MTEDSPHNDLTAVTPPGPASAINYTWDDNGDLTARGSDSFSWDYEDRMVSATVSSVTTTFAYRGDGLRNSKTTGGNTTTFTWDVDRAVPTVIDDGNQYVHALGLVSMKQSGNWYYYLSDGLGSTMAVVDSSGNTQNSYTYDAYGTPTKTGSLANQFDFAGQETDPSTGLQYLRARYYDSVTGTFLSRDPLANRAGWLGAAFQYASGDPVARIDPMGLDDGDYGGSTEAERNWCYKGAVAWGRLGQCADAQLLAGYATQLTNEYFGENTDNSPANAFKHCCWIGLFALDHGISNAKGLGDRHEKRTKTEFARDAEKVGGAGYLLRMIGMDLYNNAKGRQFAQEAMAGSSNYWDQAAALISKCRAGASNGQLVTSPDDSRMFRFGGGVPR